MIERTNVKHMWPSVGGHLSRGDKFKVVAGLHYTSPLLFIGQKLTRYGMTGADVAWASRGKKRIY